MSGRPDPRPPSTRRKFLVSLGFGSLAAAIGWRLPSGPGTPGEGQTVAAPGSTDPVDSASPTSTVPEATDTTTTDTTTTTSSLTEPPALADAGPAPDPATHVFDVVLRGGRVIDPMSGFDGILNVGIDGGVITAVTAADLLPAAEADLDVAGLVVAPGFIDLLSYEPNPFGVWTKVADGVTTNLAMHGVNNYANAFFDRYGGQTPIHFGGAFHHHFMRGEDLGARPDETLTDAQIDSFAALARSSLADGFAGVAFSPEYSPATSAAELQALAEVAAEFDGVGFFHTRSSDPATSLAGVAEALELGRRTGIGVHISHFHSTGATGHMGEAIDLIERARADGVDATACVYPYDFWATTLQSFRFVGDWQARYGIGIADLQVAGTDERLSDATFGAAVAENRLVAALGSLDQAELDEALRRPWVMVGSDAILEQSLNNHPRASGTFSRLLGRDVRERGVVDLVSGLAKMTSLPALRTEGLIPAMRRKGRLQRGADADLVVFDADAVIDRATVARPDLASVGMRQVMVGGRRVLADGELRRTVLNGQALRSGTV